MARPRGKAIRWNDGDLDRIVEVTPEDVEEAKVAFREDAPTRFQDLLDAEPVEELRLPEE